VHHRHVLPPSLAADGPILSFAPWLTPLERKVSRFFHPVPRVWTRNGQCFSADELVPPPRRVPANANARLSPCVAAGWALWRAMKTFGLIKSDTAYVPSPLYAVRPLALLFSVPRSIGRPHLSPPSFLRTPRRDERDGMRFWAQTNKQIPIERPGSQSRVLPILTSQEAACGFEIETRGGARPIFFLSCMNSVKPPGLYARTADQLDEIIYFVPAAWNGPRLFCRTGPRCPWQFRPPLNHPGCGPLVTEGPPFSVVVMPRLQRPERYIALAK